MMSSNGKDTTSVNTLQRLQNQAANTRLARGARVQVVRGRMAFRIGGIKLWVPGYTITATGPGVLPHTVRVRTAKAAGNILRGISIGSFFPRT
jgi:hypothetical protein